MTKPITADAGENLPTNWGRWGADDELGTLNFITDQVRARAVTQAVTGRTVSLAHPVRPVPMAAPIPFGVNPMPAGVLQMMNYTGSPARALVDVLIVNSHHASLTHIDAVAHVPVDDHVYPGTPLAQAVAAGSVVHGSTSAFASGVTTRGVLLDLAPGTRLAAGFDITGDDLSQAEERAGVRVESGDALVVRGGWAPLDALAAPAPGMTLDAVRWMAEREVSMYVGDIGDRPPAQLGRGGPTAQPGESGGSGGSGESGESGESGSFMALHQVALPRLGLPLIDCPALEELAAASAELGRATFLFVLAPMRVEGATGIPVNPLAVF